MGRVSTPDVAQRLADTPAVRDTILRAAAGARGLPGADPRAMSHSWLFTGPPGAGRSQAALAFAAALMCERGEKLGCGECASCRGILEEGRHTDLVYLRPQELSIAVDTVRDIIGQAASRPTVARWRVIIFENADRLTDGAANALLKTVEEPTASTVIVMLAPSADPEDFSQTLRSRCRHLYIPAPSTEAIVSQLVAEGAGESDARLAAVTSLRHVGRARRLVTDPAVQRRRAQSINLAEEIFQGSQGFQAAGALIKAIEKESKEAGVEADEKEKADLEKAYGAGGKGKGAAKAQRDVRSAVKDLEKIQKKRATRRVRDLLDLALVDLAGIYRDALMLRVGADVEMTHPDFSGLAQELAQRVGEEGLVACQEAIVTCRNHIAVNVAPGTAFDGLVGRLRRACGA
ncbi:MULTISPECIES: DNA polymerase III subunit delta' [unclassified Corynebacterium]|uniref:DNA polymerase III subunit delta' n=1 Tax=unclassified Corynebacterium TaxID=2624378 RepID=UPI0034CD6261